MSEPLTCPYCNALVQALPGTPAGQRIECSRCGEGFTLRESVPALVENSARELNAERVATSPRGNIRKTAAILLVVMTSMAGLGLVFALRTQSDRRNNDKGLPHGTKRPSWRQGQPLPPLESALAPVQLPALGYLPAKCDLIAAVQLAVLLRSERAAALLKEDDLKLGPVSIPLARLSQLQSLGVEEVDHVVLGLTAEQPLSGLFVVRTRKPYDRKKLLEKLQAEPVRIGGKEKSFLRFDLEKLKLVPNLKVPAYVACPDSETVLFGMSEGAMTAIPDKPFTNGEQLAGGLQFLLRDRIEPSAPVWIAGQVEDWYKTMLPTLWKTNNPGRDELLATKSFAAWLLLDKKDLVVRLAFKCQNDVEAQKLQKVVKEFADKGTVVSKATRDGEWVILEMRKPLAEAPFQN